MNANKTEFMCFKQEAISTSSSKPLKLVDKFTYLKRNLSSTESDDNICQAKAWNDIDRLLIIWKSDLSDKIKQYFFQIEAVSVVQYGCTKWTLTKCLNEKLDGNFKRMLCTVLKNPESNTQQNGSWTAAYLSPHKPSK